MNAPGRAVRTVCFIAAALATALAIAHPPAAADEPQTSTDSPPQNPGVSTTCTSTDRTDALVDRARREAWDASELFDHLGLATPDECFDFTDRSWLRERQARWREAVELLDRIDSDALDAWLLGLDSPPELPAAETRHQLKCLFDGLFDAVDDDNHEIQLFYDIDRQLTEDFRTTDAAVAAIDRYPGWFDRLTQTLTRSVFRSFHGQAGIWRRKMAFEGRPFNRVSTKAAQRCSLGAQLWLPDNDRHRYCWHNELSSRQREREILQASSAPGVSRHHWGTDVDILSLNPANFIEGARLYGDWRWLDAHALDHGFFQPYGSPADGHAHMEERWHWSYYPVAQALWEFVRHHPRRFEEILHQRWTRLENQWAPRYGPYFDHIRDRWSDYLFNIDVPDTDAEQMRDIDGQHRRPTPLP